RTLMIKRVSEFSPTNLDIIPIEDVVKAFINGYEIKPKYEAGEWVRYWKNDSITGYAKISEFDSFRNLVKFEGDTEFSGGENITGHATPEEIKAERDRRKWAEVEPGDVVVGITGRYAKVSKL